MPITKNEFLEALREVASSEFRQIPSNEDEIDYAFSPRFMKRMQKLFRNQKKAYWNLINTVGKRVAVIFVAAVILFATACSFKPVRESIARFFTQVYETFSSCFVEGDTVGAIERVYSLESPPEGFVQTDRFEGEAVITTTYQNERGDTIAITQMKTTENNAKLDREHIQMKSETIGACEVFISQGRGKSRIMWLQDQHYMQITSTGDVDIEVLKKIVAALQQ